MSDVDFAGLTFQDATGTPMGLAEQVCASHPPLRGSDVLSRAADDQKTRIGAFLAGAVGRTSGVVPAFAPEEHPLLVHPGDLGAGQVGILGTAFGWWLRLRTDPEASFAETNFARRALAAARPDVAEMIRLLLEWLADGDYCTEALYPDLSPATDPALAAACVVLAWCETVYRMGPAALETSPLMRVPPRKTISVASLLDVVRHAHNAQVMEMAKVAERELLPVARHYGVRQPLVLDRAPLRAEGDLALGPTVLDLKATIGTASRSDGQRRFAVTPAMVRQLVGYALLADPGLGLDGIGIYAARYGLLWVTPLEPLLAQLSLRTGTLDEWRSAFASLWERRSTSTGTSTSL